MTFTFFDVFQVMKRKRKPKLPTGTVQAWFTGNEARGLKPGWRLVIVEAAGPKWVTIKDVTKNRRHVLERAVWLPIAKKARIVSQ